MSKEDNFREIDFTKKIIYILILVPTLPPPGGDVPSYLAMLNEAKEKIRQIENNQQQHSSSVMEIGQSPPVLKKIPVYPKSNLKPISVTPLPSKKQSPSMQSSNGSPLSMLSDMFIPNWFRDQQQETNHKLSRPPPLQKSSSKMPMLPPPRDFPSFEQSKNQGKLLKRKSAQQQPRPPQRIPKPKPGGGGKFIRNNDRPSNDNFPSRLRPVQFTPIEGGSSGIPYQVIVQLHTFTMDRERGLGWGHIFLKIYSQKSGHKLCIIDLLHHYELH